MASCEPIESPSGREWDEITNRVRGPIASTICWISGASEVGVIVSLRPVVRRLDHSVAARVGRDARLDLVEELFDAVLPGDRIVVHEGELGHPPQPQARSDL